MGEAAGAGAELAPEAAAAGAGKGAGAAADAAAPLAADAAGGAFGAAPEAGGIAASASPWVVDSPITAGAFDYLGAGGGEGAAALGEAGNIAPGAGFLTSDASLSTGANASGFGAGSGVLPGSSAGGQPLGAGGVIDPAAAAAGPQLSAPAAGQGATSLAPAASSAASGTAADATSSWVDKLVSGASKSLTSNPIGLALGAGGLGYNILQGQKASANQAALGSAAQTAAGTGQKLADAGIGQVQTNQTNASDIAAKGKDLEQYLTTGQLPLQYSQQVDQAINDAKTTAISNAAKNGQPTDPTKNTALAQALAQIDGQRAGMTSKIAETLFNAGAGLTNTAANVGNASASSLLSGGQNAANLSGQLYTTLTGIDSKQSEQTAAAIAALAKSLNSGGATQKAA